MISQTLEGREGVNRRQFLCATAVVAAAAALDSDSAAVQSDRSAIKAVVFDAFAIFDARSVFRLVEEMFPGHGSALSEQWRTRQFEYTWLRNSMREYRDFWRVTEDALNYAAKQSGAYFLDLNTISADKYDSLGQDATRPLFNDNQHSRKAGAHLNAESVVTGIRHLNVPLAKDLATTP